MELSGKTIVVAGVTGQVGLPLASALAAGNEVIGAARFTDPEVRARLERRGVSTAVVDLRGGDLTSLPRDGVDVVLNFAVAKSGKWDVDLRITAEGPGDLMAWCHPQQFLHCSTTGVYRPKQRDAVHESDALGDNHATILPTYSISKIAAEAVVRFAARQFGVPTTIARLSVPYGDNGGWPAFHLALMQAGAPIAVHPDAPSVYRPIHEDDIVAQIPALLDVASVPPIVVNWGGSEAVSIEEWCSYLGEITGLTPNFETTEATISSVNADTTLLEQIAGPTSVAWRDGMRRMVQSLDPSLLRN